LFSCICNAMSSLCDYELVFHLSRTWNIFMFI
jgi:hypothetical protein